jgi:hypothetical protein
MKTLEKQEHEYSLAISTKRENLSFLNTILRRGILSLFDTKSLEMHCYGWPPKNYTLAGYELGSFAPKTDAMLPCHAGVLHSVPEISAKVCPMTRVTRLGEFLPFWQLFTLCRFLKIKEEAQAYGLLFFHGKSCVLNLTQNGLGLVQFFHKRIWSP